MDTKQNYQIVLDRTLEEIGKSGSVPSLLLHVCCAPCASYVLEYLSAYFRITAFYYNPNITDAAEYDKRLAELTRLAGSMPMYHPACVVSGRYEPGVFLAASRGMEDLPEGGKRCRACFRLRLEESARYAKAHGFDYFTTTLSISPLKDAQLLNAIGREMQEKYGVPYLYSDFKKRNGYRRSVELSQEYGLYRQDFCGCAFSKAERVRKTREV